MPGVDVASGMLTMEAQDVLVPCRIELLWVRYYSSERVHEMDSGFGNGWRSSFSASLKKDLDGYTFFFPTGSEVNFDDPDGRIEQGQIIRNLGAYAEIEKRDGDYVVTAWSVESYTLTRYVFQRDHPDASLRLFRIEDVTGQGVFLRYDDSNRLTIVEETRGGRLLEIEYNNMGRISEVWLRVRDLHRRRMMRYEYDRHRRLVAAYDVGEAAMTYEYDDHNFLIRESRRDGSVFDYIYDSQQRCVKTYGLDNFDAQTLVFDELAKQTQVTDSCGGVTTYVLGDDGQIKEVINPVGGVKAYQYDDHKRIAKETDENGAVTAYAYDDVGNRTLVVNPLGNSTEFAFDPNRRPVSFTMGDAAWKNDFDDRGRLVAVVDPMGAMTKFSYDSLGDLVSVEDPLQAVKTFKYNEFGDLVSETDFEGGRTNYAVDIESRIIGITDALGNETKIELDAYGNRLREVLPDGQAYRLVYDSKGNLREHVDPLGRRTRYRYGSCDRLLQVDHDDGSSKKFVWGTAQFQLLEVINELGETYRYEYDIAGRLIRETDFEGQSLRFEYDLVGNCIAVTDASANTTRFEYDGNRQITRKTLPDGEVVSFVYDENGRILEAANRHCSVTYQRDLWGRVIREQCNEHWVESKYDLLGNRIERRTSLGHVARYEFDHEHRAIAVAPDTHGPIRFIRNAMGLDVERRLNDQLIELRSFDNVGRIVAQHVGRVSSPATSGMDSAIHLRDAVIRRGMTYNAAGNLVNVGDNNLGDRSYTYDRRGRLIGVTGAQGAEEGYHFDAAGNLRTSQIIHETASPGRRREFEIAAGGRVYRAGDTFYEYDAVGRTIRKVERATTRPRNWEYTWNSEGLLESVATPEGEVWHYMYDPFGRRIRKQGPRGAIGFVWDGHVPVHESGEDGNATYLYEPDSFRPLAKIEKGHIYYCINDPIGAPHELISASGEVVWRANETAWGETLGHTDLVDCPIRFQGQWYDAESGLCYNGFRHYDSERTAYISKDPSGISPWGMHLYNYPRNPLEFIDPLGLIPLTDTGHSVYVLERKNAQGQYEPFYTGISNNPDRRFDEHLSSGRLTEAGLNSGEFRSRTIEGSTDLTYRQARAHEQAYIEAYGTRTSSPKPRGMNQHFEGEGNRINSFAKNRQDKRGKAFQRAYVRKMKALGLTPCTA